MQLNCRPSGLISEGSIGARTVTMSMYGVQIATVWEAVFSVRFDVVADALRSFLTRLRAREIRPLAFGFCEIAGGRTSLDFQEEQLVEGAIFTVQLVHWSEEVRTENIGALVIWKSQEDNTLVILLCPLQAYGSQIDSTVEIARQFANEAQGHGIPVTFRPQPTDSTRDFPVSATLEDLGRFFGEFNEEHKTFGYWIEIRAQEPGDKGKQSFIILDTGGVSPTLAASESPFWRDEIGAIECVQVKDVTDVKVYAPQLEQRAHFWAYISALKRRLREFDLLEDKAVAIGATDLDQCLDDFARFVEAEKRMTFWTVNKSARRHKWIPSPERHAKNLLHTFLNGRFGNTLRAFEEIVSGAGRIDVFVIVPSGEGTVVELKMCGHGYSLPYAQKGTDQLKHYMKNRNVRTGYLMILDSRARDFSKGFQPSQDSNGASLVVRVVDVRPRVKNG